MKELKNNIIKLGVISDVTDRLSEKIFEMSDQERRLADVVQNIGLKKEYLERAKAMNEVGLAMVEILKEMAEK